MGLSLILIVVTSSIWVLYDSDINRISITNKPYSGNTGRWAWFFSCLLLWIISFPYYMIKRSRILFERKVDMLNRIRRLEEKFGFTEESEDNIDKI